jgi:IS30 family transposase
LRTYRSLFVQGRGSFRKELAACLRGGRADSVEISERPPGVADDAVPGFWEADLLMGKNDRSAVGTLVERDTRYALLLHLPDGHDAVHVLTAMRAAIATLPEKLQQSAVWEVDTSLSIYFSNPRSPWRPGSNEITNGLLRQWMPKDTNLRVHSAADLAEFESLLNGRPRKTLDYLKPCERLPALFATSRERGW